MARDTSLTTAPARRALKHIQAGNSSERARARPGREPAPARWLRRCAALLLLAALGAPALAAPVEVLGLFADRAVVHVAGNQRIMRVGETSPEGVELLSANAREAVIRYQGQEYTLSLSSRVSSGFRKAEKAQVTVSSDELGQYRVRGAINNHYVNFLIDTGASVVALSSQAADRMGLNYLMGEQGVVQTAQGTTESYFVVLDEVTVAGITAHNVQAAVIDGAYPVEILLGMSFLRQVSIQEQGGVMTLVQKF